MWSQWLCCIMLYMMESSTFGMWLRSFPVDLCGASVGDGRSTTNKATHKKTPHLAQILRFLVFFFCFWYFLCLCHAMLLTFRRGLHSDSHLLQHFPKILPAKETGVGSSQADEVQSIWERLVGQWMSELDLPQVLTPFPTWNPAVIFDILGLIVFDLEPP